MIMLLRVLGLIGIGLLLTGCDFIKGSSNENADKIIKEIRLIYKDDCWIEEKLEDKIKDYSGVDLDLTPSSPETK